MRFEFLISPISASSSRRIEAFEIQSLNGHFARFHLGSIWVRRASEEERKSWLFTVLVGSEHFGLSDYLRTDRNLTAADAARIG